MRRFLVVALVLGLSWLVPQAGHAKVLGLTGCISLAEEQFSFDAAPQKQVVSIVKLVALPVTLTAKTTYAAVDVVSTPMKMILRLFLGKDVKGKGDVTGLQLAKPRI